MTPTHPAQLRSETIYSPAHCLKELKIVEDIDSRDRHMLSAMRIKTVIISFIFWLLRHMLSAFALLPVRLLHGLMRILITNEKVNRSVSLY